MPIIDRTTRLRWRRRFRLRRRQVEDMGMQAEEQLERHFFRRLGRLADVRRFILSWILLVTVLIGVLTMQILALSNYYQNTVPVAGGTFTEGIIGSYTNANPLYAAGSVDNAVSQLIFSGLLKFDHNNKLAGNLAESWVADEREVMYTVTLRPNLKWQDGKPLTAEDVVFTYRTIQNADAQSPLFNSWQKITVEAKDARTVVFTLPSPLSSFPDSLTNGIVPRHLLQDTPPAQLRSIPFNTVAPVGSGPFKWDRIEVTGVTPENRSEQIGLVPNPHYHGSKPKLQRFIIRSFREEKRMVESFETRELSAMSGLGALPEEIKNEEGIIEYSMPLTRQVTVFFKTTHDLLADVKVRQALVQAVDQKEVVKGLGYPVIAARSPFLPTHIGYSRDLLQLNTNVEQANKLLDEAGWKVGADGIRSKDKRPLQFQLFSQSTPEYQHVTSELQRQWKAVGVNTQVLLQQDSDFKSTVSNHGYDMLLYSISLGNDPDVYAYWHSTQADVRSPNRMNFSEYKSTPADKALEAGRSRSDPALRAVKYKPFLETWRNDAPALTLYQPRYLYVSRGRVHGLDQPELNSPINRYSNLENWMIRLGKATK